MRLVMIITFLMFPLETMGSKAEQQRKTLNNSKVQQGPLSKNPNIIEALILLLMFPVLVEHEARNSFPKTMPRLP